MVEELSGKTVYNGITMGKVMVLCKEWEPIRRARIKDSEYECGRVQSAINVSKQQLAKLYYKSVKKGRRI